MRTLRVMIPNNSNIYVKNNTINMSTVGLRKVLQFLYKAYADLDRYQGKLMKRPYSLFIPNKYYHQDENIDDDNYHLILSIAADIASNYDRIEYNREKRTANAYKHSNKRASKQDA